MLCSAKDNSSGSEPTSDFFVIKTRIESQKGQALVLLIL
jgi:hypothetical protein